MMTYHRKTYSATQDELYNKLIDGFKAYSKKEWYALNQRRKQKVIKRWKRAQAEINLLKQQIILNTKFIFRNEDNSGILDIFDAITVNIEPDPEFECKLTNEQLGITKEDLINLFISKKLLPANFREL